MRRRTAVFLAVSLVLVLSSLSSGAPRRRRRPPPPPPLSTVEVDPLRALKIFSGATGSDDDWWAWHNGIGPNVVIAIDRGLSMQYDNEGSYYDLAVWDKTTHSADAAALGVSSSARYYRRKYRSLLGSNHRDAGDVNYTASRIDVLDETNTDYAKFFDVSRLGMARDGVGQAVKENQAIVRFGLVQSRHGSGDSLPSRGNDYDVTLSDAAQSLLAGDRGSSKWSVTITLPTSNDVSASYSSSNVLVQADESGSSAAVLAKLELAPDAAGGILPAGRDPAGFTDNPLNNLLLDTKTEVVRLIAGDDGNHRACRNTVVILVANRRDGTGADTSATATQFAAVSAGGVTRRVPIYVIAIGPPADSEAQLRAIATNSGGMYFSAVDGDEVGVAASEAVQAAYQRASDLDAVRLSEYQMTSPIIGTVNLKNAKDINGGVLPATDITTSTGATVPQRNNLIVTAGFNLPGFAVALRGFRAFKPVPDSTQPSGYKFVKDGTMLWTAHLPSDSTQRNIYTFIPGTGMVSFTTGNASVLRDRLTMTSDADAQTLINIIRGRRLGPIIDSTPAVMDPPSLEPPPDADYGNANTPGTFASERANRRSLLFYGGNDGMLHAIDARTGVEVWAFIPYNLLPKLKTVRDGQSIDKFDFFVDGSPKIADVKVNGAWRTYMFIGQGPGGTFYQCFDVSDAGNTINPTDDAEASIVGAFGSQNVIPFKWSFPSYSSFDYTINTELTPFGDLGSSATAVEKSVGQTWSSPAIGQLEDETGPWVMIVGSGYLGATVEAQGARGNVKAGHTLYVLNVGTGAVMADYDVGDDTSKNNLKNAFQGDPSAIGPPDTRYINKVYAGDTEGNLWRFSVTKGASSSTATMPAPVKVYDALKEHPIYGSLALLNGGGNNQYILFSTGIDILPSLKKISKFKLIGVLDTGANTLGQMKFEHSLAKADGSGGDERATSAPAVAGDVVFFTTTTEFPHSPCRSTEASLFALKCNSEECLGGPAYDSNGDNVLNSTDRTVIKESLGSASAVFVSDQHLYFGAGTNVEVFGDPEDFNNGVGQLGVRVLSWRELR